MIENYLAAEALIIARLQDRLTGEAAVRAVLGAWDMAQIEESTQPTPAVHIYYDRDDVLAGGGKDIRINQVWTIAVAIRNHSDILGIAARQDAGPILSAVHQALQGWKPSAQHGAMNRTNGPPHWLSDSGISYHPLTFTTLIVATSGTT
jgi:hypothetical protein